MALLPPVALKKIPPAKAGVHPAKENVRSGEGDDDDDDFKPLKKKPKLTTLDIQGLFPNSSMTNCTFNISVQPPQ